MTSPPRPPRYINLFETFRFLAGDHLVVPIGVSHIFLRLQEIQSREWEKNNKRLRNEQYEPGVNSKCKTRSYVTLCIPVSIYRLTLAWISSENSTTHEECWLILTRLPSLLQTSSHPTGLSAARCRLPTRVTLHQLPLLSPFVQLSSRVAYPLPVTPRYRVQNPLSGFVPKQTKESSAWRTSYIMLQGNRRIWFVLVSTFNGIFIFEGYLVPNPTL